jgi:hypothetical protein
VAHCCVSINSLPNDSANSLSDNVLSITLIPNNIEDVTEGSSKNLKENVKSQYSRVICEREIVLAIFKKICNLKNLKKK